MRRILLSLCLLALAIGAVFTVPTSSAESNPRHTGPSVSQSVITASATQQAAQRVLDVQTWNEAVWNNAVWDNAVAANAAAQAAADAAAQQRQQQQQHVRRFVSASGGSHKGYATAKECVENTENGGDYGRSSNASHFGRYQFSYNAWVNFGGDPNTWGSASPEEQDRVFENAWSQGPNVQWQQWLRWDGCG